MTVAKEARLPDFIIAGAPRCGTTWLYQLLDKHPAISLAHPIQPEPKFFLVDDEYQKGIRYYRKKWFSDVSADKICGEKSTNYLENSIVAERIKKHIPDIKLIFILRNPVDRAYSNYLWSKKNGYEQCSFARALVLEAERDSQLPHQLKYARPHAYFSRGLYAEMLQSYLRLFPKDNVLILRFEMISNDPQSLAQSLHNFLGVSPRPHDADGLGVINSSIPDAPPLEEKLTVELGQRYHEANKQLALLLGSSFMTLWGDDS